MARKWKPIHACGHNHDTHGHDTHDHKNHDQSDPTHLKASHSTSSDAAGAFLFPFEPHAHGHASQNERRTLIVVALTVLTMVAEISVGYLTGSMALMADGWHMASHAGALGLAVAAYWFARRESLRHRFAFGTGKIGALAGFTSALLLAVVSLSMVVESTSRLFSPVTINFEDALVVAVLGLAVNGVSAKLLHHGHDHGDHNIKAAYVHVLADALTSVVAIVALLAGRYAGMTWMDPVTGILGSLVVGKWAWGLLRGAGATLLDMTPDHVDVQGLTRLIEARGRIDVLGVHVWEPAPRKFACLVRISAASAEFDADLRETLCTQFHLSELAVDRQPIPKGNAGSPDFVGVKAHSHKT